MNGFTKLGKHLVRSMLMDLEATEIVIYTYMMFKVGSMNAAFLFTSQMKMSLEVGLDQSAISKITDRLKEKNYIFKKLPQEAKQKKNHLYIKR